MAYRYFLAFLLVGCATSSVGEPPIDGDPGPRADADPSAPDADPGSNPDAPPGCEPTTEMCNGVDDDCDGFSDEDFAVGMPCTSGQGACAVDGEIICDKTGEMTVCNAMPGTPGVETCNAVDDDCDGTVDNGPPEACNGVDDNCDGIIDEGFGVGTMCDGPDGDLCNEGTIACAGMGAVCGDMTADSAEACNSVDDDCDGAVDESWPNLGTGCTAGVGACAASGTTVCAAGGAGTTCTATAGTPGPEYCGDGVDSNCDGLSDPACPSNDYPAGAIDMGTGGLFSADLTYAHDDVNTGGCAMWNGRDVFYTFTLPTQQVVYLDTFGTGFDSVLRVFAGSCTALGAVQACTDDSCSTLQTQVALSLPAGTYCVVADAYSSTTPAGTINVRYIRGGRDGTNIPAAASTQSGNTCGATNTTSPGCATSSATEQAYWFTLCPADARSLTASTCGATWDTTLYLRAGEATAANLACNDDSTCSGTSTLQSTISASISGANLYWLTVDGYSTNCGAYNVAVSM